MSVIKLLDENGNIIDIPSLKGDDGKLAYEYAKEGGYTGTRDEFLNDLSSISVNLNNHLKYNACHEDLRNECENLTPSINTDDENKMLRVVDGSWAKVDDVIIPRSVLTNLADIVRKKMVNQNAVWCFVNDRSKLTYFEFADDITSIGQYVFRSCKNLSIEELPDSITRIKDYAFSNCQNMPLNKLPNSLTYVGPSAFKNCYALCVTKLPDTLNMIEKYGFSTCKKLYITEIPASVTSIGDYAFEYCTSLTSITFKGKPTSIGNYIFNGCSNLKTINVPWAEGEVSVTSWGAPSATKINYNYTG